MALVAAPVVMPVVVPPHHVVGVWVEVGGVRLVRRKLAHLPSDTHKVRVEFDALFYNWFTGMVAIKSRPRHQRAPLQPTLF